MSKVKKIEISRYELLYIVPNKYTEDEANEINKKTKEMITNNKAKITFSENWGKKNLAYPINNNYHGYYYLIEFDLSGNELAKIDNILRMSNEILRHQIVKKKTKTLEQIKEDKVVAAKIAAKTEEKAKDKKEKEKAKDKKKLELKDLDEKLEKILETDDLI
ncbi:MAG: 30S ribosomal protein S6 [Patescibacteria group bacterium]